MEELKTATGKTFDCDYFNPFPPLGQVFIRLVNISLLDVARVFGDPVETVQLYWANDYVAHHTKIINIIPEGDAIRLTLGQE